MILRKEQVEKMSQIVIDATIDLRRLLNESIKSSFDKGEIITEKLPEFTIEIPADRNHGDFATNIAMISAKILKMAPRKIAELIVSNLNLTTTYIKKAEMAGPGFINFFLNDMFYISILRDIET